MRRDAGFTLPEMGVVLALTVMLMVSLLPIGGLLAKHFTIATEYATDLQRGSLLADRLAREVRCARAVVASTPGGARASGAETLVLADGAGTKAFVLGVDRAQTGRLVTLERRDAGGTLVASERLGVVGNLTFRYGVRRGRTTLVYYDVDLAPRAENAPRAALSSCALVAAGERP